MKKVYVIGHGHGGDYMINEKTYKMLSQGWRLIVQVKEMEECQPKQAVLKFIYDNFDEDTVKEDI